MKRFLVLTDKYKDKNSYFARTFIKELSKYKVSADLEIIDDDFYEKFMFNYSFCDNNIPLLHIDSLMHNYDLIVVFGGDGSFLRAAKLAITLDLPIFAVNIGRLGFMLSQNFEDVMANCQRIAEMDFHLVKRGVLRCTKFCSDKKDIDCFNSNNCSIAINDCVVSSSGIYKFTSLTLEIDDNTIEDINGDGLIISSPLGSTAYSLAAGGPVIDPSLNCIVITPICSHSLAQRSYVLSENSKVKLRLLESSKNRQSLAVLLDGVHKFDLLEDSYIEVEFIPQRLCIANLKNTCVFVEISKKMHKRNI